MYSQNYVKKNSFTLFTCTTVFFIFKVLKISPPARYDFRINIWKKKIIYKSFFIYKVRLFLTLSIKEVMHEFDKNTQSNIA